MYPVSATFKDYIKRNTVSYSWSGTIVDKEGTSYEITNANIIKNSSRITKRCSTDQLSVGTTCAAELELNLYLDVDRYKLYGGTSEISFILDEGIDANENPVTEEVPMGIFTISECNQSNGKLSIIAYDNMQKFDKVKFTASLNNEILTPFNWLSLICDECGVVLGNTSSQIAGMPNGNRPTGFADVVSDADTWRDVLGYMAAYLGGFAYIGRDGKLYIGQYHAVIVDTITASFRSFSNLSDFRTTYDGLYATYKDGGVQEYVSNNNSNGLVLDLGINPFLQFNDQTNRLAALQEIIDAWNGVYYVPYDSDMPLMPHYDLADVIQFTNNQAGEYDYGAITEIVYNLGSQISVNCCGDNPILAAAQDRFTKTVAGLSSSYNNGQEIGTKNFWLLHTENASAITVGSTKLQVAEIEFKQITDVQRLALVFTCELSLSTTAIIDLTLTVDDEEAYTFEVTEEKAMKGKRILNATKAFRITGKGTHIAKVYMKVTDNSLKWSDLG